MRFPIGLEPRCEAAGCFVVDGLPVWDRCDARESTERCIEGALRPGAKCPERCP